MCVMLQQQEEEEEKEEEEEEEQEEEEEKVRVKHVFSKKIYVREREINQS